MIIFLFPPPWQSESPNDRFWLHVLSFLFYSENFREIPPWGKVNKNFIFCDSWERKIFCEENKSKCTHPPPRPSASPGEPGEGLADASSACRGKALGPSPDLGSVPRGGPTSPHTHRAPRVRRDRWDSCFLPPCSCLTDTAHLRLRPGECRCEHNSLFLACLQGWTRVRGLLFLPVHMVGTQDPQL